MSLEKKENEKKNCRQIHPRERVVEEEGGGVGIEESAYM
jgi:hypothetical protein